MQIRAFQPEDLEGLYRLDQSCYPPGIAYSRYALREFLGAPGARAWVAEETETLVGFVIVQRIGRDRGHVITLDVREDQRRRGIGTKLLTIGEEWLARQGVRRVRLETAVNNEPAVAFWQKAGYEVTGRLPRYYLDRDDAYRMEKELA
ncbi:MAG TPA: N-acetyltransferase [Candidatus Acidoferrales bacterium]|nr:N-acetyltransferase [Candidatus Acidoferrales bacterium]